MPEPSNTTLAPALPTKPSSWLFSDGVDVGSFSAAAGVTAATSSVPPALEDAQRRIADLSLALDRTRHRLTVVECARDVAAAELHARIAQLEAQLVEKDRVIDSLRVSGRG